MKRVHHAPDYIKNKDASVIKKGSGRAVPDEQWEVNLNLTPDGKPEPKTCFNPMRPKDRAHMHVKVNECDH